MIFQFPANIVCRRLGPCLWLPSLAVSWGIVTLGVGFTTNWTQLIACRILLGVLEVCSMGSTVVGGYVVADGLDAERILSRMHFLALVLVLSV